MMAFDKVIFRGS